MQSKSVSEILVKLLEHRPSRLTRELVENLLLHSDRLITPQECSKIVAIAVNEIELCRSEAEVEVAWSILRCLAQSGADLTAVITVAHLRALAKHAETSSPSPPSTPSTHVVRLFLWFTSHGSLQELKPALAAYLPVFVGCCGGDVSMLSAIVELLSRSPALLSSLAQSSDVVALCEAVCSCLAKVPGVRADPALIEPFRAKLSAVRSFLKGLLLNTSQPSRDDVVAACLNVVYNAICNSAAPEECQALSVVLELVDAETIPHAVRSLLESSSSTSTVGGDEDCGVVRRALELFCRWTLVFPEASRLRLWILALLDLLESERRYSLLNQVALHVAPSYFFLLQVPVYRAGVAPVLWRMLFSTRNNHAVFTKVAKLIPGVWLKLKAESKTGVNDQALVFLQAYCACIRAQLPNFDVNYYEIATLLKESRGRQMQSCSVVESFTLWEQPEEETFTSSYCYPLPLEPAASSSSRLDLGLGAAASGSRAGLYNLGNTCYANSVLQALLMTHRFCFGLLELVPEDRQPLLCKLQTLFTLLLFSRRPALSPGDVLDACRPAHFLPGHQQDSSEFLIHLLNLIREQEKERSPPSPVAKQQQQGEGGDVAAMSMSRWTTEEDLSTLHRKAVSLADCSTKESEQLSGTLSGSEDSGIHSLSSEPPPPELAGLVDGTFGGRTLTCYRCLSCGAESLHGDAFTELQLSFPEGEGDDGVELDVQALLDYYVSPEALQGDNSYSCGRCQRLSPGVRQVAVVRAPPRLLLVVKHFRYDGRHRKLLRRMRYREELQLPVHRAPQAQGVQQTQGQGMHQAQGQGEVEWQPYTLYAAVVHSGSRPDQGHYYAVARESSGRWLLLDDEAVGRWTPHDAPRCPGDTPYVLFYARPGEALQPPTGELSLEDLQPRLRELVLRERRNHTTTPHASSYSRGRRPPPGGSSGGGGSTSTGNALDDAPNFIY